jgi:glycosyltransferase involved in cell wall biosynthesis
MNEQSGTLLLHGSTPSASIVIATRNRQNELQAAVASALGQNEAAEVIVIDDGSTDGTPSMMATQYPHVRFIRHNVSKGYIVRRNEGASLASGRVLFSIDDDAVFSTPAIVQQVLLQFDSPCIGAVAMPFVDVRKGPAVQQHAPDAGAVYCTDSFVGTAHAIRRDVFLRLGGYRERLVHQGEEGDFCVRMLDAGFVVRLGVSDPVHHFESPTRDLQRMDHDGVRNAVLFAWQNVPLPPVLVRLPGTALKCLAYTWQPGRFRTRLAAVAAAMRDCRLDNRSPVSRTAYRAFRRLRSNGPRTLEEIAPSLNLHARSTSNRLAAR